MTELEVQEIENRIVSKQMKQLIGVPRVIRRQLSRMKEDVLKIWNIDTIYSADIQLKIFRTVANSILTLDLLEIMIKKYGKEMSRMSFDKFLRKIIRKAKSYKKKEITEIDLNKQLKSIIDGKVKRFNN